LLNIIGYWCTLNQDGEEFSNIDEKLIEEKVIERVSHISSELAHDLRSPLQTIQNAIYLIERSPENTQLYSMVKQSLQQATAILDGFRDYYNGHVLQKLEIDLMKVIELAFSELEFPENIDLIKEIDPIESITIDPVKMALAIRKLLINSIEAMPNGGKLTIKVVSESQGVKISIIDTGKGIPPDLVDVIYTPFLSGKKQGRGLGVPTAYRIIESHGGTLDFSTKFNEGTVFTIWLPGLR
jgi:signal transduction histidine kinase